MGVLNYNQPSEPPARLRSEKEDLDYFALNLRIFLSISIGSFSDIRMSLLFRFFVESQLVSIRSFP